MKPLTISLKREIPIVDANEQPIFVGSVLELADRDDRNYQRGVVIEIATDPKGVYRHAWGLGDMAIKTSEGSYRCTNDYGKWVHIPRERQTYCERYRSWLTEPFDHDQDDDRDRGTQLTIDGILALLPKDLYTDDLADIPRTIEDALAIVVDLLEPNE